MSTTKAWRCDRCYPGCAWDDKADLLCGLPAACEEREVYVVPVAEAKKVWTGDGLIFEEDGLEPWVNGAPDPRLVPYRVFKEES